MENSTDDSPTVGKLEVLPSAGAINAAGPTAELVPVKSAHDTSQSPLEIPHGAEHDVPQRSKGKIVLIMAALCVRKPTVASNA